MLKKLVNSEMQEHQQETKQKIKLEEIKEEKNQIAKN